MDLPPDKAKLLRQYDDCKKWDMICDQELVSAKDPPSHYLHKLKTYLDPKASRSSRVSYLYYLSHLDFEVPWYSPVLVIVHGSPKSLSSCTVVPSLVTVHGSAQSLSQCTVVPSPCHRAR